MMGPLLFALLLSVGLPLYCIFFWKLMPKDATAVDESKMKKRSAADKLPQNKQVRVYIIFMVVIAAMLLNRWTCRLVYLAPAAGVLALADAPALRCAGWTAAAAL